MLKIKIKNCCCCNKGGSGGDTTPDDSGVDVEECVVTIDWPTKDGSPMSAGTFGNMKVYAKVNDGEFIEIPFDTSTREPSDTKLTVNKNDVVTLRMTGHEGTIISNWDWHDQEFSITESEQTIRYNVNSSGGSGGSDDPYDGYRYTPNDNAYNNSNTTNVNVNTGEAGHTVNFNMTSWIYNSSNPSASDPGVSGVITDIGSSLRQAVNMSLELIEGGELLDDYELIHYTAFKDGQNTGNTFLVDSSEEHEFSINLNSGKTVNPECYYTLLFTTKEDVTGTIKFRITQATSGKVINYTYVIN